MSANISCGIPTLTKTERAGFTCGERIVVRPIAARKLIGKDFRGCGLHPFG